MSASGGATDSTDTTDTTREEPRVRVGVGAVVVRGGRLLLVRTTYGWAKGKWVIPNGGQRPAESLAACAERELREEAGLEGRTGGLVAVRSLAAASGSDTFLALAVEATGEPRPDGREIDAARFFELSAVRALGEEGAVVRLHRLLAEHVLGGEPQPAVQSLPALDRYGEPAEATIYFL